MRRLVHGQLAFRDGVARGFDGALPDTVAHRESPTDWLVSLAIIAVVTIPVSIGGGGQRGREDDRPDPGLAVRCRRRQVLVARRSAEAGRLVAERRLPRFSADIRGCDGRKAVTSGFDSRLAGM